MRKPRNNIEISMLILDYCRIPRIKTHVTYHLMTNFTIAGKYLDWLISEGLIEKTDDNYYRTTIMGENALFRATEIYDTFDQLRVS